MNRSARNMAAMKYFFYKLVPPRPDFAFTMTSEESAMMGQHSRYWDEMIAKGNALALGPVAATTGVFGIGILQADSFDAASSLVREDPAIKAQFGFTSELSPMLGLKKS